MKNRFDQFISFKGEIGRDDYLKASLVLTLGLIALIALAILVTAGAGISFDQIFESPWLNLPLVAFAIRFTWPITIKRWRDLGPKLSKYWLGIVLATTVLPNYKEISNPGLSVLTGVISLLSLYPYCKLLLEPGRKHARLQVQVEA